MNSPDSPNPIAGHGWISSDNIAVIRWMAGSPAPEVVISLLSPASVLDRVGHLTAHASSMDSIVHKPASC